MTHAPTRPDRDLTAPVPQPPLHRRRRSVALIAAGAVAAIALAIGVAIALNTSDDEAGETADVNEQGQSDTPLHGDAAHLVRRADGLVAELDVPTPTPGSYEYPTADMIPPNGAPHPPVSAGASDAPEVFTAWMFVFNHPDRCTEGRCDLDDVGPDTDAQGGSYQVDGKIADGDRLVLAGTIRLGQDPAGGARLVEPLGAEVHLAIAPHGRALSGADGWRQLNGAVGGPDFWWAATFAP